MAIPGGRRVALSPKAALTCSWAKCFASVKSPEVRPFEPRPGQQGVVEPGVGQVGVLQICAAQIEAETGVAFQGAGGQQLVERRL